jgi:molecular chaperone HtpG
VRRVFITEDCRDLLPPWLRFVRGIVDSEDLPLNVSRQVLQESPIVAKIRANLISRVLGDLADRAKSAPDEYVKFWETFGAVLKEGLYEAPDRRDALLPLLRFRSTAGDDLTDLSQYASRMRPGQEHIYILSGESADALARSPHLEGFKARGIEVLLLTDPIDEFWTQAIGTFEGKAFRSITRGGAEIEKIARLDAADGTKEAPAGDVARLIARFKLALGDAVKDVRVSAQLTESAACLVADASDPDLRLERLLKRAQRIDVTSKRILEINPRHPLVLRLIDVAANEGRQEQVGEIAHLLLDQARISEGEAVPDPAAFAKRLASALEASLGA